MYKYGADGLRVQKTVGSVVYNYYYSDGVLVRQTWGSNYIDFLYDESGLPYSFVYGTVTNGTVSSQQYYYIKNLQGDITAITDSNGTILAKYTYDVWGKPLSITDGNGNDVSANKNHIANINPLRYRGYYYDSEMGVYYLLTRYYDPVTRRFRNADGQLNTDSLLGFNMFAYCGNNPVMYVDANGEAPLKVARYLLSYWIYGNGESLYLNKNSFVTKTIKKSKTMKEIIDSEIRKYEKGSAYGTGNVTFKSNETDLWLGVRNASYEISITKETKTTGFWFFKKTKTRYIVSVKVYDTYNFNTGDEKGDGIGSWLNNLGYWAQKKEIGKEYYWEANYEYKTKWE